jgi:nuclear mRNA export protein PCID2/THP1
MFSRYLIRQSHQLRFRDFEAALEGITGQPTDMDEVECILANLIFKGYMKGYMSHQKKVLVVSKAQPFPQITDVSS